VHDEQAEATVIRERALLLEALTLLVQRQTETETALADQLARTNNRVATVERHCVELEARLADIDTRLQRLALEVQPDPGLPQRVAVLQAQVERLHGHAAASEAVPRAQPVAAPGPMPVAAASASAPPPVRPRAAPLPPRRAVLVASGDTLWDRLGATNQDRASVVLIGTGVLVVVFAALAQLRVG
jgi:hypothetical protein